jgi:hypothetical protein
VKGWWPGAVEWSPPAPLSAGQAGFVRALRSRLMPDFEIAGKPQSDGLTFRHTSIGAVDCWFICNLQPNARQTEVTLKTAGKVPQIWDAMDKSIRGTDAFKYTPDGRVCLTVDLDPWESQFVLLSPERGHSCPPVSGAGKPPLPGAELPDIGKNEIVFSNDWNVSFQGLGNFRTNLVMKTLADWTDFQGLENFSGQAVYSTGFQVSSVQSPFILSLGEVRDVASVRVNGQDAGRVWMQPYRVDISKQIRPGSNQLEITVANLLWNYAAGLKEPVPVPAELQAHYGAAADSRYSGWKSLQDLKKGRTDRLPSGLIGPVTVEMRAD